VAHPDTVEGKALFEKMGFFAVEDGNNAVEYTNTNESVKMECKL
jgi:hypothetical protein